MTTPKQNGREELIKEVKHYYSGTSMYFDAEGLADFILEYRKRVVEPLVKYKAWVTRTWGDDGIHHYSDKAIDQALKNAGVDT